MSVKIVTLPLHDVCNSIYQIKRLLVFYLMSVIFVWF